MSLVALALLLACRHGHRDAPTDAPAGSAPPRAERPQLTRLVGPAVWAEGVALTVPSGWVAEARPPATVALDDPETGATLAVFLDAPLPAERAGMLRVFADEDRYRSVPVVTGGGSETWISRDPTGPTVVVWHGAPTGRPVRVELTAPQHALFRAQERFGPVLAGATLRP